MAETTSHMNLVKQLVRAIESKFNIDSSLSFIDQPKSLHKPKKVNGYIPDYYYFDRDSSNLIIGEAKTLNDVNQQHTIDQLTAFLKECNNYKNSTFVFAAPWQMYNFSKGMIKKICKEKSLSVVFLVLDALR